MLRKLFIRRRQLVLAWVATASLLAAVRLAADDWPQQVHSAVAQHQLPVALALVERQLTAAPEDMEAHVWRGRLLAWTGHWPEAIIEYRLVLAKFPGDVDVLTGLADVLLWQQKYTEALALLNTARDAAPRSPEILARRARILSLLQRSAEARTQYQAVLAYDPANRAALDALSDLAASSKYQLHLSEEADLFNYTEDAQVETVALTARWNERWATTFTATPYHLFGENTVKISADAAYRFRQNNWVRVLAGGANPQGVVPECEGLVEYGHGFRFSRRWFKGLESSYQEHSLWYRGAQVFTLGTTQVLDLTRQWTWTVSGTGYRTRFNGAGSDWAPSESTKVEFPVSRLLFANAQFALGAENFAQVDQIGRLSARTYGGGLRYRFSGSQDVTTFVTRQDREHGQKLLSLGWSYGIRF